MEGAAFVSEVFHLLVGALQVDSERVKLALEASLPSLVVLVHLWDDLPFKMRAKLQKPLLLCRLKLLKGAIVLFLHPLVVLVVVANLKPELIGHSLLLGLVFIRFILLLGKQALDLTKLHPESHKLLVSPLLLLLQDF